MALSIAAAIFWIYARPISNVTVKPNSILKLHINNKITEHQDKTPLYIENKIGLDNINLAISKAKDDNNIKGILITFEDSNIGWAQMDDLKDSLLEFKSKGKFIIAYGEQYNIKSYYLASICDNIFLHPEGALFFNGISYNVTFLKGLLDKLEIEPIIFRAGSYKSAVEPLTRTNMSNESKEQAYLLINSIYESILKLVSKQRGISIKELNNISNDIGNAMPKNALKVKLVDKVCFMDEVENYIKEKLGFSQNEKTKYIDINQYYNSIKKKKKSSENKIAVLYAEGDIVDKNVDNGNAKLIRASKLIQEIKKVKDDKSIKALVLRINSPGGSVMGSANIWKELELLKEVKPVIASMSSVCASGGYYISLACNKIVASPLTITGSIGVWGMWYNKQKLFENKLGITFDSVKTNKSADWFSNNRSLLPNEREAMQNYINDTYYRFIDKVCQSRNISKDEISKLAEGRVWTGELAKKFKLIDELGNINDAIKLAAKTANLENYEVVNLQNPKIVLPNIKNIIMTRLLLQNSLLYKNVINTVHTMEGAQARLLYDVQIN